jgi:hypothetical protein
MAVELDVRQPVFLEPGGGEVVDDEDTRSVVSRRMPTADEIGRIAARYDFQPVT